MADREIIAATLAAAILSAENIPRSGDRARDAVDLYRRVLVALDSVSRAPSAPNPDEVSIRRQALQRQT